MVYRESDGSFIKHETKLICIREELNSYNNNVMFLLSEVFIVNFYAFIGNLMLRKINIRGNVYE